MRLTLAFALLACLCLAQPAPAADEAAATPVTLTRELYRLPGNDPWGGLLAVLWIRPEPGWHVYSATPSDSGQPAEAALDVAGAPATALFPRGEQKPDVFEPDKTALIYETPTPVFVRLPQALPAGAALTGQVKLFSCSNVSCWPVTAEVNLPLEGGDPAALPAAAAAPWWPEFLALRSGAMPPPPQAAGPAPGGAARPEAVAAAPAFAPRSFTPALEVTGLLKAAVLAFLAGFVLNFMPCVLPVVCLKLSGLLAVCVEERGHDRYRILREHNFFFALGIVAYFLILSLLLGLFGLAWGEIFQAPGLALVVSVVLFALSLSLFGVFHLPVVDMRLPAVAADRCHTKRGAFVTGMLATLLATPCSGPFLGGVLAWTLLQPLPVVMTVFAAIGLGMSAPYGILAIRPDLAKFLPRPGAWMAVLEKILGFLLAATCIYFLSLLPSHLMVPALMALWATGLAAFAWGKWTSLSQTPVRRLCIRGLALALAGAGLTLALAYQRPSEAKWIAYTPEAFADRLGRANLVLDFTADWCPTCKVLERTVLTPERLADFGREFDAVFMKVDLTSQSLEAMALLRALGSRSIPLAGLFPKGAGATEPLVLRDIFTAAQLEQAMSEAFGKPGSVK